MLRLSGTNSGDYRATHYNGVDSHSVYRWESPETDRTAIVAELFEGNFRVKRPDLIAGLLQAFPHDETLKLFRTHMVRR